MKKNDRHEPYCGCQSCKPLDTTDIPENGDWPITRPEPQKQRPPKGPDAVPPDGGG